MGADTLRVAVLGASGHAGLELLRIVLRHPRLELAAATSEQRAGVPVGEAFPALRGLVSRPFEALAPEALPGRVDVAFSASTTHRAPAVRLREAASPTSTSRPTSGPDLASRALVRAHKERALAGGVRHPELYRGQMRGVGCRAAGFTHVMLLPLCRSGASSSVRVPRIVLAGGVSGAGRKLETSSRRARRNGGGRRRNHRHWPKWSMKRPSRRAERSRHLARVLPTIRGIATRVLRRRRSRTRRPRGPRRAWRDEPSFAASGGEGLRSRACAAATSATSPRSSTRATGRSSRSRPSTTW